MSAGARAAWALALLAPSLGHAAEPAGADASKAAATTAVEAPPSTPNATYQSLIGDAKTYHPLIRQRPLGVRVEVPLLAVYSFKGAQAVPVDAAGNRFAPDGASDAQFRAGLLIDSGLSYAPLIVRAELEGDIYSGVFAGGDTGDLALVGGPVQQTSSHQLRKGYGRVSMGPFVTVAAGFMTSHWGMGLLANDGAHTWTPGSAYFSDPRGGDRVLRALVASGPWTGADVLFALAVDQVQGDDIFTVKGDKANQIIGSVMMGHEGPRQLGGYYVHREQEAADGKKTTIDAFDVYGKYTHRTVGGVRVTAETEAALITGTTDLGPTADHPTSDVLQFGLAARVKADAGSVGGVFDFLWASGDQDFDEGRQSAFKADPNFEMGLLLFRHVMAAQTARAAVTAADPDLVGVPSEDLDRYPTRGAVSNTAAFFPRLWARPIDGLEVYFGPLVAFSQVPVADPRETRLGGGTARNALGGTPGGYLGTELDVGVRYRLMLGTTRLMLGAEGGVFQPGNAFADVGGALGELTGGGRLLVRYEL